MTTEKQGSLFGAILLISGCCIGAGMLGLPVISAAAGFFPSFVMFFIAWLYMFLTGLLLLEVNLWNKEEVGIISMSGKTLGVVGQAIAWILFLFLFYSLLVAYIAASGAIISDFSGLPQAAGSVGFLLLFSFLIYLGTNIVDQFNRILMLGLIVSYFLLVVMGLKSVQGEYLKYQNWNATLFVIPVMVISFGYHNLVPSLKNYLGGDRKRLVIALFVGSFVPLAVYLLWQMVIMGNIPPHIFKKALDNEELATSVLIQTVGASWLTFVAEYFAFFAIITSFLAVALSLVDFLADGFHIKKTPIGKICLCSLALLPPFLFSLWQPLVFLSALNYAGAFGAVILFGILPACMVWRGRYQLGYEGTQLVPGGKGTLIAIGLFSMMVVVTKIAELFQWIDIRTFYEFSS